MAFSVDVICNCTGEVRKEGMLLAAAHIWIAKQEGKIVREDIHNVEMDDIDGGGQMEVHDIFVDFPDVDLASEAELRKRSAAWWQYENGGGQVR
tara:strand:- start:393 stop:674 length:282 start_codon:yes stop_codon:yes gene_type:complete